MQINIYNVKSLKNINTIKSWGKPRCCNGEHTEKNIYIEYKSFNNNIISRIQSTVS